MASSKSTMLSLGRIGCAHFWQIALLADRTSAQIVFVPK
jgi:hypothetical protein